MALELPTTPVRVRIAPSPTGDPHVGTAYVALFNRALALKTGGKFILRIEDTDRTRYQADSERQISEALRWLGLDYDEGPDIGGPHAPYRQSERTEKYREAAQELLRRGKAYRCFCTAAELEAMREQQTKEKKPLGYDGRCKHLTPDTVEAKLAAKIPFVIRLATPTEGSTTFTDALRGEVTIANSQLDDQVLLKSDDFPTYHLANVVDDRAMGVTHVIRAEEWISSTPKHVLLYEAFGWPRPVFAHMPLLRNNDKNKTKISKRKNPVSLIWYRENGYLPEALVNFLGLMGYSFPEEREIFTAKEFYETFDPTRLRTTGPVFDMQKLEWLNGEWIRRLSHEDFVARVLAFAGAPYTENVALVRRVAPLVQERIKLLKEWDTYAGMFFRPLPDYDAATLLPKKGTPADVRAALTWAIENLPKIAPFAPAGLEAACKEEAERCGLKVSPFFMILRVAVTGSSVSPPLFESMEILGKDETLARLRAALAKVPA